MQRYPKLSDKSRRPPSRGFISQDVAGNGEIMGRVGDGKRFEIRKK